MTLRTWQGLTGVLAAVALGLAVTAALTFDRAASLREDTAANAAVADEAATAVVVDAVTRGLERAFAYDYRDPERASEAADSFLSGQASEQYAELYQVLEAEGRSQQLVHDSSVTRIGVQRLTGTEAEVLVFLDQQSTRATDGATRLAPAQLKCSLVHREGTWKLTSIEML